MTLDSVLSDCIAGILEHNKKPYVTGTSKIGPRVTPKRNQRYVEVRQGWGAYRVTVTKIPISELDTWS